MSFCLKCNAYFHHLYALFTGTEVKKSGRKISFWKQFGLILKNGDKNKIYKINDTYEELEELEDPLVCEDIKCIPTDGVDNGQAVYLVLD